MTIKIGTNIIEPPSDITRKILIHISTFCPNIILEKREIDMIINGDWLTVINEYNKEEEFFKQL